MEVPYLSLSAIWSLDNHVSVVDQIKISVVLKLWNKMEVSLYVKSKLLIELSLSWFFLVLINIDDFPFLVHFSIFVLNNDVSSFSINTSLNCNDLSSFVNNEITLDAK